MKTPKQTSKTEIQTSSPLKLQVQPDLSHRGGFETNLQALFPPAGTFEAVGGREGIARLVDRLYDRFEADKVLRPAFGRDLTLEREKVKHFFEGWFVGASIYTGGDWPPGLFAAHSAIAISRGMAGRWIGHFLDSLAETVEDPSVIAQIKPVISRLAMGLVNRPSEPAPGERLRCGAYSVEAEFLRLVQRDDASAIEGLATSHAKSMHVQGPRLLLVAAVRGKALAVEALLRSGTDANAVSMLAGGEANVSDLPMIKMTPLCGALAKRRENVARLLIENGAQYDIFTTAFLGDTEGVEALLNLAPELANAIDPACDFAEVSPLYHAVSAEKIEMVRLLFDRGANIGSNRVRLIRMAANCGNEAMVDLLLEQGADPADIKAGLWVSYPKIAEKLLQRGADVNFEPGKWIGMCCTGNSGHKENLEFARALLRCGANVSAAYKGSSALHCAAKAGFVQVAEALIEHGAEVRALDTKGRTPLETLETSGKSVDREAMRRLLLAHGA